jgi:catechol 2,3-dioxygenase-like lactoylglutathione lyase family enzyme
MPNAEHEVLAHVPTDDGRVKPTGYAHVVLLSTRAEALIDWYCGVAGLQLVMRSEVINFLTFDHSQDRLAIITTKQAIAPGGATGLDHIALDYRSLKDLVAVYHRAGERGLRPHWCVNHGIATSMYFHDPDGRSIELTVGHFPTREAVNAWLSTGEFNRNPIGVTLSAEDLVRRVESGEEEREILRPHPLHGSSLESELRRMGLEP